MELYNMIMKALDFQINDPTIHKIKELVSHGSYFVVTDGDKSLKKSLENSTKYDISNVLKIIDMDYDDYITFQNKNFEKMDLTPPDTNMYLEIGEVQDLLEKFGFSDHSTNEYLKGFITKAGIQILYEPVMNHVIDKNSVELFNKYKLKWNLSLRVFLFTTVLNTSLNAPICIKNIDLVVDENGDAPFFGVKKTNIGKISDVVEISNSCKAVSRPPSIIVRNKESILDSRTMAFSVAMSNMSAGEDMDSMLQMVLFIAIFGISEINFKRAKVTRKSNGDGISSKNLKKRIKHDGFIPIVYNDVIYDSPDTNDEICGICNNVSGCSCLQDGYR